MKETSVIPVILCGGAGSRLWPVSRELHPKPFIRLPDGQSLLQKAYLRGALLPGVIEVLTVTNREFFFKTRDEFREVKIPGVSTSFVLEPFGQNTAAAISIAALQITKKHGKESIMLVLPADHLISDQLAFVAVFEEACILARQGKLVTFGIHPDKPETGYGYIEAEEQHVLRFIEKPTVSKAEEYLASGRFFWNSGMFCFTAGSILDAMSVHCSEILDATQTCISQSHSDSIDDCTYLELDSSSFESVPNNSIDFAVMEKVKNLSVLSCNIGWSDIGSWSALGDQTEADAQGNRIQGEVLVDNTHNCIIQSANRLIGTIGIDNLMIIDTPDAVLVADKSCAQDVKQFYAKLKEKNHVTHRLHRTVYRPWGTYTMLEEGEGFKIKRIEVKPGASLSLQMHHHRSEHWIVVSGVAKVRNDDKTFLVSTNESTYIPAGKKHRLENLSPLPLIIIEVQTGEYLGEDDIVRFEDKYGRVKC